MLNAEFIDKQGAMNGLGISLNSSVQELQTFCTVQYNLTH